MTLANSWALAYLAYLGLVIVVAVMVVVVVVVVVGVGVIVGGVGGAAAVQHSVAD